MNIYNLISSPRNLSTALMYSFAQRTDMKVIDEPFYAYYLKRRPVDHPGSADTLASLPHELADILALINQHAQGSPNIFIKNMAHHLIQMEWDFLLNYHNIFLLRNPKQLIASFAQVIKNPTMEDIGLELQWQLFKRLEAVRGAAPLVLDSGELLKNPEKVLRELCERLGLPFEVGMLKWEAGPIEADGAWAKYWYHNVHQSTGFKRQESSSRPLPEHCEALYEAAYPYYEALFKHAIKA